MMPWLRLPKTLVLLVWGLGLLALAGGAVWILGPGKNRPGAAGPAPVRPKAQTTRMFTDDLGRKRRIPKPISRMIILGGPAAETAWALGRGRDIVARSEWTTWPPPMADLPSLGSMIRPNQELIWQLAPDVIIADMHFIKIAPKIEKLGVPVVILSAVHPKEISRLIDSMGRLLHEKRRAGELGKFVRGHLRMISQRLEGLSPQDKPRAFHGIGRQLYYTASSKYGRRVIDWAGAENIANSLPLPWQQVSPEWLIEQDPDFMVLSPNLAQYDYQIPARSLMESLWLDACSRLGVRRLRLVRQGQLLLLNARLGYGLRSFLGALYLAKKFHPHRFSDIDPRQVHAQFLARFFNLNLQGSYLYP